MKVAIEGTPFFRVRTGIDHYTVNLVRELVALDPGTGYTVIGYRGDGAKPRPLPPAENLSYRFAEWLPKRYLDAFSARLFVPPLDLLAGVRPDVMLFPNYIASPLVWTRRSIVVIYDLSFVYHPEYVDPGNARFLRRVVKRAAATAGHVVTISEHSRREILECYGLPESKVSVVYPGVDRGRFRPLSPERRAAVVERFGIDRPYVLFTGTLEPRKNILGLLRAYAHLPADLRDAHALVIAGGKGWLDREITEGLAELERSGARVIRTGYVDDEDMPALFGGASVFVFPSFYEGFGIPPLEAMACGTPVIASRASSLPEVVGEAAELVDPHDVTSIADALERVLRDPERRRELSAAGQARAGRFDWSSEAGKLRELVHRS
ncbi:MAG TPA: glycosyltransferase family 1 protein [Gaiellales bacterium]|nr:glycosyltransferase family 1 protein [Gaiellales bacterium]